MIKFLQELFPWLATLPFASKLLISGAVLLIAGAALVLMWTPSQSKSNAEENRPDPSPLVSPEQSQSSPTVTLSPVETPTVKKDDDHPQPPKPMWPQAKNMEGLKRLLDRTSKTNRQILLALVDSGRDGIYVSAGAKSLEQRFHLSRNDILARGAELQRLQLIEVLELTDKNYRLHEDVWNVVGPNGIPLLRTLLH
jgi:hypothetical protein